MSRIIKFRIWKPEEKNWVNFPNRGLSSFVPIIDPVYTNNNYFIIQQFTGLKDKNRKEIYEGDIVSTYQFGNRVIGVIEYHKDSFVINGKYIEDNKIQRHFDCYGDMSFLEVIGNIFQTPELLK